MSGKIVEITRKTAFFITLFLMSAIFLIPKNNADLDLWHRLAVGKIFAEKGWIIYNDIFSYFPQKEMWVDHEWLSGVIFYYLSAFWGDYGLITLQVGAVFLILVLIYLTNQLISPENKLRISYYFLALFGIHKGFSAAIRCHCFTYLFFTLWIYLLERIRRGESGLIWIFPLTMLLWANLHGGFLAGIGLVGFYLVGEFLNKKDIKKYSLILGSIIPVTLINPYGIKYWQYILDATTLQRSYIAEWGIVTPFESFYSELGFKIMFLVLLLGYGYKLVSKTLKIDFVEVIALAVTLFLAIKHERHTVFFVITAAIFGYEHFTAFLNVIFKKFNQKFSELFNEDSRTKVSLAKGYAVYFFIIASCLCVLQSASLVINMKNFPVQEIEFIRKNRLTGNLLVNFNWGSYALWKLYPQNLVSIDGRFEENYTMQSFMNNYNFIELKDGWEDVLENYNHDIILLGKNSKAYEKIKLLPGWKVVYEGDKAAVFLPVSNTGKNWQNPPDDCDYYIKTKYENNINF